MDWGTSESSRVITMSNVNHEYKNIFIHVPKTAGTSMERNKFVGGKAHKTAKVIKQLVGDSVWDDYFTWGFVRDPLDRILSSFFHEPNITGHSQTREGFQDFVKEFYRDGIDIPSMLEVGNKYHHHFIPQYYFLCDEKHNILVEFVGKYSELEYDWAEVCNRIGVTTELEHYRKGNYIKDRSMYYDSETEILVRELYDRDYKIFERF